MLRVDGDQLPRIDARQNDALSDALKNAGWTGC